MTTVDCSDKRDNFKKAGLMARSWRQPMIAERP